MNRNPLFTRARPAAVPYALLGLGLFSFAGLNGAAAQASPPPASEISPAPIIDKPLPPSAGQEVAEEQPSPQHVWLAGHWRWQEGAYVWVASHWELPPISNAVWVEPRWDKRPNGYVLVEGFWQEAQPPAQVVAAAPTAQPQTVIVVNEPPPPPTREIIYERPSPSYVWVSGYWGWRGGRHVWINGHWDLPPRENVVWVEPRWERRGNGYVLIEGFWRDVGVTVRIGEPRREEIVVRRPPEVVVIRDAPPPPRREAMGPRPSPRHVWISGYWSYVGGRTVWMAGHWELPPRGRQAWVEPRWERRDGGYVFVEGSWR